MEKLGAPYGELVSNSASVKEHEERFSRLSQFQASNCFEERIQSWLEKKGIIFEEPSSKQRVFFDKNKQLILDLKKQATYCCSQFNSEINCGDSTDNTSEEVTGSYKFIYKNKTSLPKSCKQRRGFKLALLECRVQLNTPA